MSSLTVRTDHGGDGPNCVQRTPIPSQCGGFFVDKLILAFILLLFMVNLSILKKIPQKILGPTLIKRR